MEEEKEEEEERAKAEEHEAEITTRSTDSSPPEPEHDQDNNVATARLDNRSDWDDDPTTTCSLYISRASNASHDGDGGARGPESPLRRSTLEDTIRATDPSAAWRVSETSCGLIAAFARETDADKFLRHGDLARAFEGPVQVARFSVVRDSRYRQAVLLRDVPWAIPLQDLSSALARQGIATGNVERTRQQHVRVEVLEAGHYELLLRQGLDFFGAARFAVVPERWWWWWRGGNAPEPTSNVQQQQPQQGDDVLQCYRCQGFWHVAANCRHLPRCVRCGEPHSVEFCPRPRNSPTCCHCSGPHHAGYRQCPVRLQLLNAIPISITLSTTCADLDPMRKVERLPGSTAREA